MARKLSCMQTNKKCKKGSSNLGGVCGDCFLGRSCGADTAEFFWIAGQEFL